MRFRLALVSVAIALVIELPAASARQPSTDGIRKDVDALLAGMVAAFKRDPAAVGAYYTDAAAIVGGGQRFQGRASIDAYWKGASGFTDWSLETLETGGPADAPWAYGRSILLSKSGQKMETYFVGLLRRAPSGDLKFQIDAFTGQRGEGGSDEAGGAFAAYLTAVEKADANALRALFDDQFVIVSSTVRNKAEEIADLVPPSGGTVEYFRSDDTRTRGFGALALTTGILKWKFNGREFQRNHSTIAVKRGTEWKILAQQVTPAIDAQQAAGPRQYILAAGRRLPYLYAISLEAALATANDRTSNAIVSRNKVATEALDGRLLGDPANLVVSEDGRSVYVVNHHGAIDNTTFRQHGGRGQIAVLDVDDLLDRRNSGSATALRRFMDSGGFGALGIVLLPEMLVIANAENNLTEDGGNRITFVDRRTGNLRGMVELALGSPGFPCPDYPVPYAPPYGPPRNVAVRAPDPSFGCFPNPNGLALGRDANGSAYIFSANGGTNDVSVIDLARALRGDARAEIGRIPMQVGPWGIAATPDGRHVIAANGGSQRDGSAGNTIAVIDVDRASTDARRAEVARVRVGTDDPAEPSHPLIPSITPDGRDVIIPNVRTSNVSIVNLERALAGRPDAEVARIPLTRTDGQPARPRGSAITADGRYAVVSGGPSSPPFSQELGHIYVIDLRSRRVVATVTGVGHEPYAVAVVQR